MAGITPFRGLRYNTHSPLDLALVTAPPYDCISPEQQDELYRVHPHNIVRVILNKITSADSPRDNRYTRSAQFLRDWREGGILVQDDRPAVYIVEQEFTVDGRRHRREGFIARVRLEKPKSGRVLPHEETFSGPKEDRLKLLQAIRCNASAVMALFEDSARAVMAAFRKGLHQRPDMQTVDGGGVVNRLWVQTDEKTIAKARKLMAPKRLFIADGHHRYQTACTYMEQLRKSGRKITAKHPAASLMTMCISMSDPGLVILPTHRIVEDLGGAEFDLERFRSVTAQKFDWQNLSGAAATTPRVMKSLARKHGPAVGLYVRGTTNAFVLSLKDRRVMSTLGREHSRAWRHLDVAVLHRLILDRMLPEALGDAGKNFKVAYVHRAEEAFDAVYEVGKPLAFILRPPKIEMLREIAAGGELMPQKSTYFYPKVLSGLVLNPLE